MALVSPGVQVTIVDESNYLPAATNSVPYFLIATAQDKVSGSGVGVAAGTLKANANKAYLITSQRDLTATFGNPFFYKTTIGTPINGYELNEYGLLAAYSALGVTNRAYIQRCDIDLTQLTASLVRPTGEPNNGAYWLDTGNTLWGIFEWNIVTATFSNVVPSVITDTVYLSSGVPVGSYGNIGDYTVVATNTANPVYYKNGAATTSQTTASALRSLYNTWVLVGSNAWKLSYPTVTGNNAVSADLTAGNIIIINGTTVAVPASPNNTLAGLSAAVNTAAITGVYSAVIDNKFCLFANADANVSGNNQNNGVILIGSGSTSGLLTTLGITANENYFAPSLLASNSYENPNWRDGGPSPRPTGSVWNMTNSVNLGTTMVVKKYSTALAAFVQQSAVVYQDDWEANANLDATGGGKNIAAGTTYTQYNAVTVSNSGGATPGTVYTPEPNGATGNYPFNPAYTLQVFERTQTGSTVITGDTDTATFTVGNSFYIRTSTANSSTLTDSVLVTLAGTTPTDFVTAVSHAAVPNVSASIDNNGYIVFTQAIGGVILLQNVSGTPVASAGFNNTVTGCRWQIVGTSTTAANDEWLQLSNWVPLTYTASAVAPGQDPATGRYWYYSATNQVDIMIQTGSGWAGYLNGGTDIRGDVLGNTNSTGPIISATAPTTQSDGTALVYGDLWIDTSNLELYPVINRWSVVNGVDQWITLDNTDQTTQNGVLFADARWSPTGTANPITDPVPSITSLLSSDYLDIDAPDYTLYPTGMLLFNTRRSGFNVKSFQANYFNATSFAYPSWSNSTTYAKGSQVLYNTTLYVGTANSIPTGTVPTNTSYWAELQVNSWVTASGNRNSGAPNMGRFAQRELIVAALKAGIDTSVTIREEQNQFNLTACTAYPELIPNMLALSNERNNTVFVVGDTPMRLPADSAQIVSYATNNGGAGYATGDGLTVASPYVGVFWPSCQTTDLSGSAVVTAPSHMMVRTMIRNDEVAYPWLAPAGTRRGVVDNADRIGYINAQTGEFITLGVNQALRDVLYTNRVNPITFVPGVGITNFGNKTTQSVASSLDRINVARLVVFIRARLEEIGKQFLFEPNDQITRDEVKNAVNSLMINLVAKRGIYDYLVVCDDTNNTPARIDANELWVDIAIEPVKAVEFIYIPIRLKNTGSIAAGQVASAQAV
jgi:Phage tail sheath C-terminal domain